MRQLRHRRRGFSILSIIMVLAIIGILSQNYFSTETPSGEAWATYQQSRVRSAVTMANLRTAQTQFFMRTEGRQVPVDQLRSIMDDLSRSMGAGGRFFAVGQQNQELMITTAIETSRFSETMGLPRER